MIIVIKSYRVLWVWGFIILVVSGEILTTTEMYEYIHYLREYE